MTTTKSGKQNSIFAEGRTPENNSYFVFCLSLQKLRPKSDTICTYTVRISASNSDQLYHRALGMHHHKVIGAAQKHVKSAVGRSAAVQGFRAVKEVGAPLLS